VCFSSYGSVDSFLVSALEDVAQPSFLIANPIAPRFVLPPSPTFSFDPLFFVAIPLSWTTEMLSSASLEVSLRLGGFTSAPIGVGDGSVVHRIQSSSTRLESFSSDDTFSGAAELGERVNPFQSSD
jgi:hypothetical protein